ncbi:hypothetical protein [Kribbella deserti]|uniref:Uncharacterized protein n=1 Tax=Kribbella deserti TaxID=1926257 RepID=A0ABV6QRE8_9ACTN
MNFETELRDHMDAGVADEPVDLGKLLAGGVAHGKKLVRRRRLGQLVVVTAVLATVGGVFAYAGSGGFAPNESGADFAGPVASTSQQVPITPQAALQILLDQLPPDGRTGGYRGGDASIPGEVAAGAVWVRFSYTDAVGKSSLNLRVARQKHQNLCAEEWAREPGNHCQQSTLADGSKLIVMKNFHAPENHRRWNAILSRKDGLQIDLMADNSSEWKSQGTRPTPPLSLEQLTKIVTSPRWQDRLDAAFVRKAESLFEVTPAPPTAKPSTEIPSSPTPSN